MTYLGVWLGDPDPFIPPRGTSDCNTPVPISVRQIQEALHEVHVITSHGILNPGAIDGRWGPVTSASLASLANLPPTVTPCSGGSWRSMNVNVPVGSQLANVPVTMVQPISTWAARWRARGIAVVTPTNVPIPGGTPRLPTPMTDMTANTTGTVIPGYTLPDPPPASVGEDIADFASDAFTDTAKTVGRSALALGMLGVGLTGAALLWVAHLRNKSKRRRR